MTPPRPPCIGSSSPFNSNTSVTFIILLYIPLVHFNERNNLMKNLFYLLTHLIKYCLCKYFKPALCSVLTGLAMQSLPFAVSHKRHAGDCFTLLICRISALDFSISNVLPSGWSHMPVRDAEKCLIRAGILSSS